VPVGQEDIRTRAKGIQIINLTKRGKEIEAQNEGPLQIQNNLNALNANLEQVVNERTAEIQLQNENIV
jgi:hypothetical protein